MTLFGFICTATHFTFPPDAMWCNCVWACHLDAIQHHVFLAVCCTDSASIVGGPDICSGVALGLSCIISLSRSYLARKIELEWCDIA